MLPFRVIIRTEEYMDMENYIETQTKILEKHLRFLTDQIARLGKVPGVQGTWRNASFRHKAPPAFTRGDFKRFWERLSVVPIVSSSR